MTLQSNPRTPGMATVGIAVAALSVAGVLVAWAASGVTASPPSPPPPPGVKAADCASCHGESSTKLRTGGHAILLRSMGRDACDACHGEPGDHATRETVDSIGSFGAMTPSAVAEACATCHRGAPDHLVNWDKTPWAAQGKSCLDCHRIHDVGEASIPFPADSGPVGVDGCRLCHSDRVTDFGDTIHAAIKSDGAVESCEACHGSGGLHVRAVHVDPELVRSDFGIRNGKDGALCAQCHDRAREGHAVRRSAWERPDLGCDTCHSAHGHGGTIARLRGSAAPMLPADTAEAGATRTGSRTCERCHEASIQSFRGSAHDHAFAEKGMDCEDCHGNASLHADGGSPLGIVRPGTMDRGELTAFCSSCHAEDGPDHVRDFDGSIQGGGDRTCLSCHGVHAPAPSEAPAAFRDVASARTASKTVGSAKCATCHEDPHPEIRSSVHAPLLENPQGCEGCHGPGAEHVSRGGLKSAILQPATMEPSARDDLCLSCHGATASEASWKRHRHGRASLSCTQCHEPFAKTGPEKAIDQRELCASCHEDVAAQFRLPHHHRVPEGQVRCSDCHDLHRGRPPVRAATAVADACAKCHRSESTPRLHPHVGDRHDGCISCHVPHGTTAPRLLKFRRSRELCLSCHTPPATHDVSRGGTHRACVDCHVEVHGSDADRKLLR